MSNNSGNERRPQRQRQSSQQYDRDYYENRPKKKVKKGMHPVLRVIFGVFMTLLAITAIVAAIGYGAYQGIAAGTPDFEGINVMPTQYPSTIYDCNGEVIIELASSGANRVDVNENQLPDHVKWAFIDIEDERFYEHNGIDYKGMLRAIYNNIRTGSQEGASTITQQLIKNNVFNTGLLERSTGSSLKRKIQEQILAVELEKHMTKDEILVTYLNTINLGGGNYGIVTAAEYYFNKDVKDLTISEAAVLAAITKNPTANNPATHPEKNRARQVEVLKKMWENGHITEAQYKEALADDVYSRVSENTIGKSDSQYSYFVDALITDILSDFQNDLGYTYQQAYNALFNGGLSIYATQNLQVQEIVDYEINNPNNYTVEDTYSISWNLSVQHADGTMEYFNQNHIYKWHRETLGDTGFKLNYYTQEDAYADVEAFKAATLKEDDKISYEELLYTVQPQMSLTIMDYTNGYVVALCGGRGEKETNLSLNRATDTTRQPGSCFKVLAAFAPALEALDWTLGTAIDDSPFNYGGDINRDVHNWWGDYYRGLSTVREGIRDSMNVVAVKTMYCVGGTTSVEFLKAFGLTTIDEVEDSGVATALGGITYGVKNIELNAAYATIANGGNYNEPILYTQILNKDGSVFYDRTSTQEKRQVLSEQNAWLLTNAMLDVVYYGTGTEAQIWDTPVAGKTGTTTDSVDLWFAGYIPGGLSCAVWTGYDENLDLGATGESYHEYMFATVMSQVAYMLGKNGGEFAMPEGITSAYICTKSGKLATDICEKDQTTRMEYFTWETVPTEPCKVHSKVTVCKVTGKLPLEDCPTEEKVCITRPTDVTGTEPSGTTADTEKEPPKDKCDGKHEEKKTTTTKEGDTTKEPETTTEAEPPEDPTETSTE